MQIKVKVVPQSSRLEIAGWQGDFIRVKLTKGAHDGEANEQLVTFLAKSFHVPKSDVRIIHGEHSREKVIEISSIEPAQLNQLKSLHQSN